MDSLASFLKKLSLDDDEFSKESILAQPDFQPFLFPSRPVSFSGVPTQGPVDAYLKAVRSQILAEYDALLGRGSVLRLACTILEDDSEDSDDGSTLFRDSSTRTIEQQEILEIWQLKTPATPYSRSNPPVTDIETVVERSSLHTHLAVVRGRIALLRWNRRPEVLTAFIGASWPGHASARVASLDLTTEGDAVLVDCGYIGDLINEYAATKQLLSNASLSISPLLKAVADPSKRRAASRKGWAQLVVVGADQRASKGRARRDDQEH